MTKSGAIKCLGKSFASEDERREYFRNELRKKLPELKKIEGFPIGEDEDIITLSDPPFYTACPNPWLNDFIAEWEAEKANTPGRKADFQVDEPYASDVSEGKNNPIYNAHSYHTKVPHPAIMRYILHYTQPGDIIFDGFAGTGMTGVAAQMCGRPDAQLQFRIDSEFKSLGLSAPVWGARKAICGDLSPIASFIAYNYNTPVDIYEFEKEAKRILHEVEEECGWMYETNHNPISKGRINYTVWSDIFICPACGKEIIFWDAAVDKDAGKVKDEFNCTHCNALQTKRRVTKAKKTIYDRALGETITQTKTVPVLINYTCNGKRHEKAPDESDLDLIRKIEEMDIPYWFPKDKIQKGDKTGEPLREGITHVHHFYTKRNLWVLGALWQRLNNKMKWAATSFLSRNLTKTNRFIINQHNPNGRINGPLTGTWYIPSEYVEQSALLLFRDKLLKAGWVSFGNCIQTLSASDTSNIIGCSIDYIFTDPPFGANIMYSELNFLWESWLKVKTNNKAEAIENKTQGKSLLDYQNIMTQCFKEYYRVLKPGRWMTVEFSNTSAAVWNGIQTALQRAGFIVANVSALDKVHGGIKSMRYTTAVKQDLVISCYKPSADFEKSFVDGSVSFTNVRAFLEEHLRHLPVHVAREQKTTAIIERSPKILYDRLISLYIMRGLRVPIDAADFQDMLRSFIERDGMYFLPEQAAEYDEKKALMPQMEQMALIVTTEAEGLLWLKAALTDNMMTYQDIQPKWMKAITAVRKGEILPELKLLLEENFIHECDGRWRLPNMNEAKDREALRTKSLLKEFDRYIVELNTSKTKKLKEVRIEALHAGFKSCWEKKDFQTIITMGDRIPQNLLLEDEQLLMFYDIAKDRM